MQINLIDRFAAEWAQPVPAGSVWGAAVGAARVSSRAFFGEQTMSRPLNFRARAEYRRPSRTKPCAGRWRASERTLAGRPARRVRVKDSPCWGAYMAASAAALLRPKNSPALLANPQANSNEFKP